MHAEALTAGNAASPPQHAAIRKAAQNACDRIAPLWPLKHFVAVNPFLGFSDRRFAGAAAYFKRVAKTNILMPRAFYMQKRAEGAFAQAEIEAALSMTQTNLSLDAFQALLDRPETQGSGPVVATVADILDALADGDRQASRTAFMRDEISRWCAGYYDEGQASWRAPWRGLSPYAAWREAMRFDRNPEIMGVRSFRSTICGLPLDAVDTIALIVEKIGIPEHALEDYLFRALFDIQGWAAYARYRSWDAGLYGEQDHGLIEVLAIRVAWGYALFRERNDEAFLDAWAKAMADAERAPVLRDGPDDELNVRLVLHLAYEWGAQKQLLRPLMKANPAPARSKPRRPAVQAAFCIDVRSEIFRRALEAHAADIETIGFAGFFGFPIEYIPIGNQRGGAQCPVLLKPSVIVCEAVKGADVDEETEVLALRLLRRRAAKAWKAFKLSAVSSFSFVETMGLGYFAKIVGDSLGWTRPVPDPARDGLSAKTIGRLAPRLAPQTVDGRKTGFALECRVDMAEAVLRAMSLTTNFARVVLLAGHGSASVNNPHASSLDCGACGGHTGEANARVAAALLNDPGVRLGLAQRDITIPEDTWFIAGLHNTTTDDFKLFDADDVPSTHLDDVKTLQHMLYLASLRARVERAPRLKLKGGDPDASILERSRDWSQVRPEWGLAGNACFIAAPRERTLGLSLKGRAFLHSYDWRNDREFKTLELIMTAPMVVASWINLQYFGSSVNNAAFGSGNKTLHNVVGALGVLEGNGGDLRVGLPWQSVHDGYALAHDPLRLSVVLEAPIKAVNAVIEKSETVRQLVENKWLHLFVIDENGDLCRYWGALSWAREPASAKEAAQ